MRRLETTSRFERRLKVFLLAHPELKDKTYALINRLILNPFDMRNKTHRLSGPLRAFWSAHISWHYRLVFLLNEETITLINIGSHDEVY
jgi:addiction module RelE/StbE family toxin